MVAYGDWWWVELMTQNPKTAKDFYGAVLGWAFEDAPEYNYVMANNGIRNVAGFFDYSQMEQLSQVPAHWAPYLKIDDVDAAVVRSNSAGGAVIREPWDLENVGRIAVLSDPGGASFNIMAPAPNDYQSPPRGAQTEHGDWHWQELRTRNPDTAQGYYTEVAGWTCVPGPFPGMDYRICMVGEKAVGGIFDMTGQTFMDGVPEHWMPHLAVDDVDAAVKRVDGAGGSVLGDIQEMPGVGRFAAVRDPEGAVVFIMTPEYPSN